MESTVHRIKQYIDFKGISVKKFEESVGFSNGAFASQYKNNKTIGVDKVENILSIYPDISPEWLLTGNGPMLRSDERAAMPETRVLSDVSAVEERLMAIIKEKDLRIEDQAKTIGRLEERLENAQTNFRGGRNITPYRSPDEKPASTSAMPELPPTPSMPAPLKGKRPPHK